MLLQICCQSMLDISGCAGFLNGGTFRASEQRPKCRAVNFVVKLAFGFGVLVESIIRVSRRKRILDGDCHI